MSFVIYFGSNRTPFLCCAELNCSVVSNSVTLWTAACQAPLSMQILQASIPQWVALPSSRGSSQPTSPRSPTFQANSLPSEPPQSITQTNFSAM